MPAIAVDFGSVTTKVAIYDRTAGKPTLAFTIPSVFYVPRAGAILVGQDAIDAVTLDRCGVVRNFKTAKLGGRPFFHQGRFRDPVDIAAAAFNFVRQKCAQLGLDARAMEACGHAVSLYFELDKRECLRNAALRAGFKHSVVFEEPASAVRYLSLQDSSDLSHAVVCDLGAALRLALVYRSGEQWRPHDEIHHDPVTLPFRGTAERSVRESLLRILQRDLKQYVKHLKDIGVDESPLLITGGGSCIDELLAFATDVWQIGRVHLPTDAAYAAVLGGVDAPESNDKDTSKRAWKRYDPNATA